MPDRNARGRCSTVVWVGIWLGLAQCVIGCAPKPHSSGSSERHPEANQQEKLHEVVIRKPAGAPRLATGTLDGEGKPLMVSCGFCHANREPNGSTTLEHGPKSFHVGLQGAHGNLACVACHNPSKGYDSLRLASGQEVPYSEVMQLCAQCHGTAYRDYIQGSHGGMTGFWDLRKGPRMRNNCVDCHQPHRPRYPMVWPARGPVDSGHHP